MTLIKAIETTYRGVKFRSKLEAQWSFVFDLMGIEWHYEPQAFHTSHGPYLPDFFLPKTNRGKGSWVEVKAAEPTDCEYEKLCEVVGNTENTNFEPSNLALFLFGSMLEQEEAHKSYEETRSIPGGGRNWVCGDYDYLLCRCSECDRADFQFEARAGRNCNCRGSDRVHRVITGVFLEAIEKFRWTPRRRRYG
jgi:hypothetical protein